MLTRLTTKRVVQGLPRRSRTGHRARRLVVVVVLIVLRLLGCVGDLGDPVYEGHQRCEEIRIGAQLSGKSTLVCFVYLLIERFY